MEEKKLIVCARCGEKISHNSDLVVVVNFIAPIPYHNDCYSKELKGLSGFGVSNQPINGSMGVVQTVVSAFGALIFPFIKGYRFVTIIFLIGLYIRWYSWYHIERYLK